MSWLDDDSQDSGPGLGVGMLLGGALTWLFGGGRTEYVLPDDEEYLDLGELTKETMWSTIIDKDQGIYKLDNIPFYGPQIATDDEFYAEFDESEKMLTYKKTTKHSGNSIILVVITKKGLDKEIIRNRFKELDCKSEGLNDSYQNL